MLYPFLFLLDLSMLYIYTDIHYIDQVYKERQPPVYSQGFSALYLFPPAYQIAGQRTFPHAILLTNVLQAITRYLIIVMYQT